MRVPWTAKRSNQSILKEINSEYSLEGLMLKLQYFGHQMRRTNSLEKTLIMGKIKDKKRRGKEKRRWLESITNSVDMFGQTPGDSEEQGILKCCSPQGREELDITWRLKNNNSNTSNSSHLILMNLATAVCMKG